MNIRNIQAYNSLKSTERLKSRKQIEMLFQKGEAFSFYPIRTIYRFVPKNELKDCSSPVRVGFSVPKRRFKKAYQRNRIKRLLREAWRIQKHDLYKKVPDNQQLHCFLIYYSKEILNFDQIKNCVENVLQQLASKIQ